MFLVYAISVLNGNICTCIICVISVTMDERCKVHTFCQDSKPLAKPLILNKLSLDSWKEC